MAQKFGVAQLENQSKLLTLNPVDSSQKIYIDSQTTQPLDNVVESLRMSTAINGVKGTGLGLTTSPQNRYAEHCYTMLKTYGNVGDINWVSVVRNILFLIDLELYGWHKILVTLKFSSQRLQDNYLQE